MQNISKSVINSRRTWALFIALAAPLAILMAFPPIPQDPHYHTLADARTLIGVPHALNVVSNLGFLAVGLIGVALCRGGQVRGAALSWTVFFAGVVLVAFGSAYYHSAPDNDTLLWDRLPMTIAFMALFTGLFVEHLPIARERVLLAVTILVGISSLAWWRIADDLRLYGWVQLAPFLAIAVLLSTFPGRYDRRYWLAWGLACYGLSKVAELNDARIFALTSEAISGHTLKHVLAALAPLCVYAMLRTRTAIPRPTT